MQKAGLWKNGSAFCSPGLRQDADPGRDFTLGGGFPGGARTSAHRPKPRLPATSRPGAGGPAASWLGSKDGEFITDTGSRDTISPGATLAVANTLLVSFAPRSLNIRALEKAGGLVVDEAAETLRETVVLENASTPLNRLASESPAVPSFPLSYSFIGFLDSAVRPFRLMHNHGPRFSAPGAKPARPGSGQ